MNSPTTRLSAVRCDLRVGKWVIRTNSLSWDVKKIVRDGMSLDHPRRETWKSSSNLVTSSVALAYLVHVYPYLPIMTACCMLRAN